MIRSRYEENISPNAAAGPGLDPGWLDAVIDLLDTCLPAGRRGRGSRWVLKRLHKVRLRENSTWVYYRPETFRSSRDALVDHLDFSGNLRG